jgi:hypothetical protein
MKSKIINVLVFTAGAAIGSAVTWKVLKTRYERIVQEEIESIRETFAGGLPSIDDTKDDDAEKSEECPGQINWNELEDLDEEDEFDENTLAEYADLIKNYTNDDEKGGVEKMSKRPYVISPYDFGEADGYEQIELTYYADGILEDENYDVVTDVDEMIGTQSLYTFGEYEDDAVFVRNDHLRIDFQILKDYRTYEEARGTNPDHVGDE